jgi:hypothetical protein
MKVKLWVSISVALFAGVCLGWWEHGMTTSLSVGRFYVQDYAPFTFAYPERPNGNWQGSNDGFTYSTGIPTDNTGLILPGHATKGAALEVRAQGTSTEVTLTQYIDTTYPAPFSGVIEWRNSMRPYSSPDQKFSGYIVNYEQDGMAGYTGEALIIKSNQSCGSSNPSDCSLVYYTLDNIANMYTPTEFSEIVASIKPSL